MAKSMASFGQLFFLFHMELAFSVFDFCFR